MISMSPEQRAVRRKELRALMEFKKQRELAAAVASRSDLSEGNLLPPQARDPEKA